MYVVADTETSSWDESDNLEVKLICCIIVNDDSSEERHRFYDSKSFFIFLDKLYYKNNKKRFRVYFHNLKFDSKFYHLRTATYSCRGSTILKVKFEHFELYDSIQILLSSVKELGQSVGLEKMNMEKDDLVEYCYRDCEIVNESLKKFSKMLGSDVENLSLTLGAEMQKKFVRECEFSHDIFSFATEPTPACPHSYDYRQWYFGARTEVYNHSSFKKLYVYDINSMYAHVQTANKFPIPPYKVVNSTLTPEELLMDERFFGGVFIVDERDNIPFLPVRFKDRTLFCKGVKKVFLFREELEYCINKKYRIATIEAHYCSRFGYIFNYIKDMYEQRKKSKDEFERLFLKACMVRSYGKFAERQTQSDVVIVETPDFSLEESLVKSGYLIADGCTTYPLVYSKSRFVKKNVNIVIGMRITALARLLQQQYIDKCRDYLVYTDTDSFFLSETILEDSKELGHVKLEKELDEAVCVAKKCYFSSNLSKIKGVPRDKVSIDYFSTRGIKFRRNVGFMEANRRHLPQTAVLSVVKQARSETHTREVFVDGSTLPIDVMQAEKLFGVVYEE